MWAILNIWTNCMPYIVITEDNKIASYGCIPAAVTTLTVHNVNQTIIILPPFLINFLKIRSKLMSYG